MEVNKINYNNLFISIAIIFTTGFIYNKYKINVQTKDHVEELSIIKKYLLNENDYYTIERLSAINKPIIWVPIIYKKNARKWESFGSRSSNELNADYLYLTIRSIINKCGDDFHIALIDDNSFKMVLDNWTIDLNLLEEPQKDYVRLLGLVKILHKYGGILMEPNFVLFKSLKPIWNKIVTTSQMSVAEFPNKSADSHILQYIPSTKFLGCIKNSQIVHEFENYLEILISGDYTNEINFEDKINKWLYSHTQSGTMNYIDGTFLGVKDSSNKLIDLDRLTGSSYLDLNVQSYALYIPHTDLVKRNCYNWFVYLNTDQVLESNTNIGKYLLISNN